MQRTKLTVGIAADGELDVIGYCDLDHCRLFVHNLLDGNDDLVHKFLVDLLPVLEPLDHVIDELLCHLILDLHAIIVWLDRDGINVQTFGSRGFVANLNGSIEVELSDNLLAVGELELGILIVGVELGDQLEVTKSIFWLENGSV